MALGDKQPTTTQAANCLTEKENSGGIMQKSCTGWTESSFQGCLTNRTTKRADAGDDGGWGMGCWQTRLDCTSSSSLTVYSAQGWYWCVVETYHIELKEECISTTTALLMERQRTGDGVWMSTRYRGKVLVSFEWAITPLWFLFCHNTNSVDLAESVACPCHFWFVCLPSVQHELIPTCSSPAAFANVSVAVRILFGTFEIILFIVYG